MRTTSLRDPGESNESLLSLRTIISTVLSDGEELIETRRLGPGTLESVSKLLECLLVLIFEELSRLCFRLCFRLRLWECRWCRGLHFFLDFIEVSSVVVVSPTDKLLFRFFRFACSSLSECSIETDCELSEEMVTVSTNLGLFRPLGPGDELGDQLANSLWRTGESLFQSVSDNSRMDTPEGPGTGVCQPTKKGKEK